MSFLTEINKEFEVNAKNAGISVNFKVTELASKRLDHGKVKKLEDKIATPKEDIVLEQTPTAMLKAQKLKDVMLTDEECDILIMAFRTISVTKTRKGNAKVITPEKYMEAQVKRQSGYVYDPKADKELFADLAPILERFIKSAAVAAQDLGISLVNFDLNWGDIATHASFKARVIALWKNYGILPPKGPHVKSIISRPGMWAVGKASVVIKRYRKYMGSSMRIATLVIQGKTLPSQRFYGVGQTIDDTKLVATANYIPLLYLTYNEEYKMGRKTQTDEYKLICDEIGNTMNVLAAVVPDLKFTFDKKRKIESYLKNISIGSKAVKELIKLGTPSKSPKEGKDELSEYVPNVYDLKTPNGGKPAKKETKKPTKDKKKTKKNKLEESDEEDESEDEREHDYS